MDAGLGPVVTKVIDLLDEEAKFLGGVDEEIESLTGELQSVMAFLDGADAKADFVDKADKVKVTQLRQAALQIESVIDKYTQLTAQQQGQDRCGLLGCLQIISCQIIQLKSHHRIASEVQELKRKLKDISQWRERYNVSSSTIQSSAWYDRRRDARYLEETEVVGFGSAMDDLVEQLEGESHKHSVVSVVGMGGLGKTTLAHQLYNRVKGRFDSHAWIDVSQSYDALELLKSLMTKLCESRNESPPQGVQEMGINTMEEKLRDYLKGKSYVVVFDDVWNESFWGDVKNALGSAKSGRALITTRDVEVANFCKVSSFVCIHHLQPLTEEKSWELFCNKAFQYNTKGLCPLHLQDLASEIVKKCEGLPLAIVAIAGLSTKNQSVSEWSNLLINLRSQLQSNTQLASITKILLFSYYSLPPNLKSCFLYFGIFPENYSIRRRRLIRQWIAEGFVHQEDDKDIESTAEDYLKVLIGRSLVQVSHRDFDGQPQSCRVHDLLREVIISKMKDTSFCQVLRGDCLNFARRASIVPSSSDNAFEKSQKLSHLRSIFIFKKDESPNSIIEKASKNLQFLKLVDFEDSPSLKYIPDDIGNLFHLRYLSVRGTRVRYLPRSIGNLVNLETLDLKRTLVNELPIEINRLRKLRHLLVYYVDKSVGWHINSVTGAKIQKGIGQLKALQKLYYIEVGDIEVLKEIMELTNLKKLGIKKLRSEDGSALCMCIQKMEHLETLDISSISEDETIDLGSVMSILSPYPKHLKRLYLDGCLYKFPEWVAKLKCLVRLRLSWSKVEDDPLKFLKNLPQLLELGVWYDSYYGKKLQFEEGAFPKLKILRLNDLSKVESIVIEEGALPKLKTFRLMDLSKVESIVIDKGAMPNLEELLIGCPQLNEFPSGLHRLTNLKVIDFWEMPPKFLLFQNFQSIQHVPKVLFIQAYSNRGRAILSLEGVEEIQNHKQRNGDVDWNSLSFDDIIGEVFGNQ